MLTILLLAVPLATGLVAATQSWRRWVGWLCTASLGGVLVLGIVLATRVLHGRAVSAFAGILRADALSAFMVIVIGAIGLLATTQSVRYLDAEITSGRGTARHATLYAVLVQGFITTMLLAVLAGNVGVMWVAVEATTIITTFLVGHRKTRGALEASWKYVIICSVGIALAFLGTVLVYLAALHAGHGTHVSLQWTSLMSISHHLDPGVMRLALGLLVLGYGTKVGLAPMHSWLPDAHSQAPAPVSALMSGVLLKIGIYGLIRTLTLLPGLSIASGILVLTLGVISVALSWSLVHTDDASAYSTPFA